MTSKVASAVIRRIVSTPSAPAAIGPYSQAVLVDSTVYVSGQIGMDPTVQYATICGLAQLGACLPDTQALENIRNILEAAGSSLKNVVKTTVLLSDIGDYKAVNEIYKTFFKEREPARAAYQVAAMPKGAKVEIEAIAIAGELKDEA